MRRKFDSFCNAYQTDNQNVFNAPVSEMNSATITRNLLKLWDVNLPGGARLLIDRRP